MKRRSVECYSIDTKSIEDSNWCSDKARPHDIEPCEKRPCALWRTSSWSACSVTCGQVGEKYIEICFISSGVHTYKVF